jgi:CheY-like chemotaxis protein
MVLTAYALDDERAAAIAAGCDAFETKPPDMERMITTIQRLLKA